MPYPMWIPYKQATKEQPGFNEELRQNWLEIERWSMFGFDLPSFPFIVVANDGTPADYTSIKEAALGAPAQATIYIKDTGIDYSDTGPTDISGKELAFVTFFLVPDALAQTGRQQVVWRVDGGVFLNNSSTIVYMQGIRLIRQGSGTALFGSANYILSLNSSDVSDFRIGLGGTVDSLWSSLDISGTFSGLTLAARGSQISTFNTNATWSGMNHLELVDCILAANSQVTMTASTATNNDRSVFITGCIFSRGAYIINGADWAEFTFTGNGDFAFSSFGPTLGGFPTAITLGGGGLDCNIACVGNNLRGCDLTLNGQQVNVTGVYKSVTIDATSGSFDLAVGESNLSYGGPATGVVLNASDMVGQVSGNRATDVLGCVGDNNVVSVSGLNYTNAVNVSGNNNKFILQVGPPATVDTGAGNVFL